MPQVPRFLAPRQPAGEECGLEAANGFGEVDVVAEEVRAEVAREGEKVDERHAGRGHDGVGSRIVCRDVRGETMKGDAGHRVVYALVNGRGADPGQGRTEPWS